MARYTSSKNTQTGENVKVTTDFLASATVTVEVLNLDTDTLETLTDNSAPESAVKSGSYTWPSANLDTQPVAHTQYKVFFTDDKGQVKTQKFQKGGFPDDIQQARFENAIFVDPVNGTSGQGFPQGTRQAPIDNMADARAVAVAQGITEFKTSGAVVLNAADYSGFRFQGGDFINDSIDLTLATDLDGAQFLLLNIQGDIATGDILAQTCILNALTGFSGIAVLTSFLGTIEIKPSSGFFGTSELIDCISILDNLLAEPIFDFNGTASTLQVNRFTGVFEAINMTHASARLDFRAVGGKLSLGASNTNGTVTTLGTGEIIDTSTVPSVTSEFEHVLTLTTTDHQSVAGSLGKTVADNLDATVSSRESESSASSRATTNQTEHDATQSDIAALNDPTAAAIADQVWEEAIADHSGTAGSTAEALDDASTGSGSASAIADAVWDETLNDHLTAGTTGEALKTKGEFQFLGTVEDIDELSGTIEDIEELIGYVED